jgi:hypothetical protein
MNRKSHGKCKSVYKDGSMYNGEISNAKKHGKGKYVYASGQLWHDGEWENNQPKK